MDTKAVQYCQQLHVRIIRLTFLEILYNWNYFPFMLNLKAQCVSLSFLSTSGNYICPLLL